MGKLVLSRRPKERVFIWVGQTVVAVSVYKTSAASASLVFEAPAEVQIVREELVSRKVAHTPQATDQPRR